MHPSTITSSEVKMFTKKLSSAQRFRLCPHNYARRFQVLSLIFIAIVLTFIFVQYVGMNPSIQVAAYFLVLCVSVMVSWIVFYKRLRTASIKGDTLILKSLTHKSSITSVRSIQSVHSYRILGFHVTSLCYVLDGKRKKAILLGNSTGTTLPLDFFINEAVLWNKKKKANL